jgi:hypothetical protein
MSDQASCVPKVEKSFQKTYLLDDYNESFSPQYLSTRYITLRLILHIAI